MQRVLISGGGIGGLALANALRRVGIQYSLIEQAPEFGDVGFGLTMGFNSLHALRKIDPELEEKTFQKTVQGTGFGLRDEALEWIGTPGMYDWRKEWVTERDELRYGPMRFAPISRHDLQHSLLDGLGYSSSSPSSRVETLGGELLSGRKIVEWEDKDGGVRVTLDDGTELSGCALVGADGGTSSLRHDLHERNKDTLGPSPPTPYTGLSLWGGNADGMKPFLRKQNEENLFMWSLTNDGDMFLVLPMNGDVTYWSLGFRRQEPGDPPLPSTSSAPATPGKSTPQSSPEELRDWLLKKSKRFPAELSIEQYINNTDFTVGASSEHGFFRWDIYELGDRTGKNGNSQWGEGNVSLIGDAAHMVTPWVGQGAGISIEDAHCFGVYAHQLREGKFSSVQEMLRAYEKHRSKRAVMIRQEARNNEKIWLAKTPLTRSIRKAMLQTVLPKCGPLMRWSIGRLMDYDDPPTHLSECQPK